MKEIEQKTGAKISMPRTEAEGQRITVRAPTADAVKAACDKIRKIVSEQKQHDKEVSFCYQFYFTQMHT